MLLICIKRDNTKAKEKNNYVTMCNGLTEPFNVFDIRVSNGTITICYTKRIM